MAATRLADPIVGVFARSERGRGLLRDEVLDRFSSLWHVTTTPSLWWIDSTSCVALLRPEADITAPTGDEAAIAIRGAIVAGGRDLPAGAWHGLPPATGAASILYDLLERDTSALAAMRGQFALACWDGRRRRLVLARDHFGQRCMFIWTTPDFLVFCSELGPLLRWAKPETIDPEGAFWYLAFGNAPPGRTLATDIQRVPAAHAMTCEPDGSTSVLRYWTPMQVDSPVDVDDQVLLSLRHALDSNMVRRTSDTEVALLLSGGVDSTYLGATARRLGRPVRAALTIEFTPGFGMNETEYATAAAEWLGVEHHVVPFGLADAVDTLENVVLAAAEPCAAWASMSHFRLLVHMRQIGLERLVSGLGADEIFGGYDHFRGYYARFLRFVRRFPPAPGADPFDLLLLRESQIARRVLYPGVARFFDDRALAQALLPPYNSWHYASHLRSFYRDCRRLKPTAGVMEMMVAHECQHRIPDLLFANFEPISRRMGIEVAYPFLDPDVVRLAAGLSVESRYRTKSGRFSLRLNQLNPRFKHVMLKLAEDRVPEFIRARPRKSFTAPFGGWLTQPEFAATVLGRLRESHFWQIGIVRPDWLQTVLDNIEPRPSPWVFQLWALITLAGWYDRFIDRSSDIGTP